MSVSSLVTLLSIRTQSQQRADMENSNFLQTTEWNQNITNSYKELYDLLISAYGSDYYVATPYTFTTDGTNDTFDLPSDFYKLLGVDLVVSGSPINSITLKPFTFGERNQFRVPNISSVYGMTSLKYRLRGSKLWFNQIPSSGQTIKLFYAPKPTNLQFIFSANLTVDDTTVLLSDTSFLSANMVLVNANLNAGTYIVSIVDDVSILLSSAPLATVTSTPIYGYLDSTTIDGISGWEEYIIVDGAIKARIKEESEVGELMIQKKDMKDRLTLMAQDRDIGSPATVSDTSNCSGGDSNYGFNGFY